MVGIYRLINTLTDESYVGQSKNIEERIISHFQKYKKSNEKVHQAMRYYGAENFIYQVLAECSIDELNEKEAQYISAVESVEEGYNIRPGGQDNIGLNNPNVKLSEQDVYNIREAYKNHQDKWSTYRLYAEGKITESSFSNVWEGRSWPQIHYDVYTEDNKRFYSRERTNGELSSNSVFTNEEVLHYRTEYMNKSAIQIYTENNIDQLCKFNTFQAMLWGRSYSEVPVYDKIHKTWKNC